MQTPLLDDLLLRDVEHAHFGGHHHQVVLGDQITGRTQPVAIERGADLATVGEGDGGRSVPGLHQGRVILIEGVPLLVHQTVAGPGLGDQDHHGVGE